MDEEVHHDADASPNGFAKWRRRRARTEPESSKKDGRTSSGACSAARERSIRSKALGSTPSAFIQPDHRIPDGFVDRQVFALLHRSGSLLRPASDDHGPLFSRFHRPKPHDKQVFSYLTLAGLSVGLVV
ncbi:hypothetical protein [Mesorhizobium sp.]|uniref:hypothetical protein n=1 Tax=Mesorhizobium sp. TaxID=1871066 RepID=UPI002600C906|nr:hypothetical protein [Mesorhizobium sp.]